MRAVVRAASSRRSTWQPAASRRCRCASPPSEAAFRARPLQQRPMPQKRAIAGAKPLPMTGYKLDLLQGLVRDLLERLAG